ncbi:MAG: B12-binding domain-containing radical SAM protein [Acidobacteria bacterium]|nr:B12-binding domain-containing radical SAM protein [Acidobacteriota bacterium]MCA1618419.1 B12-binding domain-containing radical SAM protein [Acidobacteriota bacterium]
MKILLYNPDNGVTRNFMPHLWMFLLQSITPPGHEVILIDGNARAMDDEEIVRYAREQGVGLVGIGAMTRMIAKAYRVADALRAAGVKVVMGGPHVTECPDEALGRDGGPRHADAVALGEADETWPLIVEDAARGELKDVYQPERDAKGNDLKPSLQPYPHIPWETLELEQFSLVPSVARPLLSRLGGGWGSFYVVPIETGRGCPYGCEFCTVTGFFGDSIRFRTNESVVEELLRLKERARRERGQIAVFFIDDNLAINIKRVKSLLRDIIDAGAQVPWVAQISANLLRDEELCDLIAESGGKWVFIGMESIDPANMADVNKNFSKPGEYGAVLERLARRNIFAITSFIFGMDNDTPGVAARTIKEIESWPPGLPVFGQLTPFPATPLYERLEKAGRLARPKHWLDFAPFVMAHAPLKMSIEEARAETRSAWEASYSPERNAQAVEAIAGHDLQYRLSMLVSRLFFRGIYFPQMNKRAWARLIFDNRRTISSLVREGFGKWRRARRRRNEVAGAVTASAAGGD